MYNENEMTKLIIVSTEKCRKYGTYLVQLISAKDDKENQVVGLKDGSVEAVLWSEKDYKSNLPTLPSWAHVLFIGDSKLTKTETTNMDTLFKKYGMKYMSLGRRAAFSVDNKLLDKSQYEQFIDFCSSYEKNFDKVKLNAVNTANTGIKLLGVFAPVVYPAAVYGLISGSGAKAKINDQQYTFLTLYAYVELLSKFLER